jgi:hypothetical protein
MDIDTKRILISAITGLIEQAYDKGVEDGKKNGDVTAVVYALLKSTIEQVSDLHEHADTAKDCADSIGFKKKKSYGGGGDENLVPSSDRSISKIVTFLDDNEGYLVASPDDDSNDLISSKDETIEATTEVWEKSGLLLATLTNKLASLEK